MAELPVVSGRKAVKAFSQIGYKEVRKGTLRALIRQAGLTVDEFVALL